MSNYGSKLSLNIILHITILFTILTALYILYISKVISNFLNNELAGIVKTEFKNNLYVSKNVPITPSLSIQFFKESIVNNTNNYIDEQLKQTINNDEAIKQLQMKKMELANSNNVSNKIDEVETEINIKIVDIIKNFDYEYYVSIYKKESMFRKLFNETLFTNIILINIIIIVFSLFFTIYTYSTGNLSGKEIFHIVMENLVTFIFVGMIELWFFLNVASQFIPAPPSLIFVSLFTSIKKILDKIV
jgi:hypothetical protein